MFILGFAIVLFGFLFGAAFLGGWLTDYVDLPSFLIIVIPLLGILTATKSFKVFYGGIKAVIWPKKAIPEELIGQAASLFRLLSKSTAIVSAVGFLVCLVNILFNLDMADPNAINIIGPNIAAGLITPMYGLTLIAALFEPMVFNLKKHCDAELS